MSHDPDDPGAIYRPLLGIKPGASRSRVRQLVDRFRRTLESAAEARKDSERSQHLNQLRRANQRFDAEAIASRANLTRPAPEPEVEVDDDAALAERLGLAREPHRRGPLERPADFDSYRDDDDDRSKEP